jgi:pyruvate-formate lyase-activating enzyme
MTDLQVFLGKIREIIQKSVTIRPMKPTVLLINPPIYDFSAYDFWLKPYGLLRVGGMLREQCSLLLYDFMDREHPEFDPHFAAKTDVWGRGPYPKQRQKKPAVFSKIPRYYNRFGQKRAHFQQFLTTVRPPDAVLIQSSLTYWYPGIKEVIDDVRHCFPGTRIVIGGFYATCCGDHAAGLGADIVVKGDQTGPVFDALGLRPPTNLVLPAWELYPQLRTGIVTLTKGCPFACGYCYVPQSGVRFSVRPLDECIAEMEYLVRLGAENIAFYDDALLYRPHEGLFPFLEAAMSRGLDVNFHTPNALHARFLTAEAAQLMVKAGVKTFYLGFESRSEAFHGQSGGKVVSEELVVAGENLRQAGADLSDVTAYEMLGHPRFAAQQLEDSMRFAAELGIRVMLSDFSPIPGTPDGELCRDIVDLNEPLLHNKTAFPILSLGPKTVGYYKDLCRFLNKRNDF